MVDNLFGVMGACWSCLISLFGMALGYAGHISVRCVFVLESGNFSFFTGLTHSSAVFRAPAAPIHHLRRFGCRAYRLIPEEQRLDKKLGERLRKCMIVGYVHHTTKLWKLYDPEFKKVLHCLDVEFDEDVNCYISCPTMIDDGIDPFGLPTRELIHANTTSQNQPTKAREAEHCQLLVALPHHWQLAVSRQRTQREQVTLLRGLRKPEAQIILLLGLRKPEAQVH
jgi:hypothetical protein